MDGLSLGRIVHVKMHDDVVRPAVVTRVIDAEAGTIAAQIFRDPTDPPGEPINIKTGLNIGACLEFGGREEDNFVLGTWRWPPRT